MAKRSIIMDVDTGVDDAMALMLAAGGGLNILGITTVYGNSPLENTTRNTLKMCELLGLDVPVAAGADRSFLGSPIQEGEGLEFPVHGQDGLGDQGDKLPVPNKTLDPRTAPMLMADLVRAAQQPVSIVATGPMTNVATFLLAYPELHDKIDCIALMGGAAFGGNVMPSVEANIWHDPDAMQMVLLSGVKVVMFGLDATMRCFITDEERDRLKAEGGRVGGLLRDSLEGYSRLYQKVAGLPGAVLHDSLPVAWLLDESVVPSFEHRYVQVDLDGAYTRGCTVVDVNDLLRKQPNAYVAMDADREKLINMHLAAVKTFA